MALRNHSNGNGRWDVARGQEDPFVLNSSLCEVRRGVCRVGRRVCGGGTPLGVTRAPASETLPTVCPPFFGGGARPLQQDLMQSGPGSRRAPQTGCFAGAAGLGKSSQGAQGRAQRRGNRRVACAGERSLDVAGERDRSGLKGWPGIRCGRVRGRRQRRPKSYRRDNCFVARERSHRPRWLILRCRLSGP